MLCELEPLQTWKARLLPGVAPAARRGKDTDGQGGTTDIPGLSLREPYDTHA